MAIIGKHALGKIMFMRTIGFLNLFQDRVIKFCSGRHIPIAFLKGESPGIQIDPYNNNKDFI